MCVLLEINCAICKENKDEFLDIFTHFVVEPDALLHSEAGHCFGERDAECITCSVTFLFVPGD